MGRKKRKRPYRFRRPKKPNPLNQKWKELYSLESTEEIVSATTVLGKKITMPWNREKLHVWKIVNNSNGKVLGVYADYYYAVKQARYKYKQQQKKIDRILLSE